MVKQIVLESQIARHLAIDQSIREAKDEAVVDALHDVDRAATPFSGEIKFPEAKAWSDLTKSRKKFGGDARSRRSERDLEIERKLSTPDLDEVPQPALVRSGRLPGQAGRRSTCISIRRA